MSSLRTGPGAEQNRGPIGAVLAAAGPLTAALAQVARRVAAVVRTPGRAPGPPPSPAGRARPLRSSLSAGQSADNALLLSVIAMFGVVDSGAAQLHLTARPLSAPRADNDDTNIFRADPGSL